MSAKFRWCLLWTLAIAVLFTPQVRGQAPAETTPPCPANESNAQARVKRHSKAVPREDCFPLESLAKEDRSLSERLLLEALDSEALYTLVGQLKPVSEGFFQTRFSIDPPQLDELQSVRRALAAWKCGSEIEAGPLVFGKLQQGERYFSAWVANRQLLEEAMEEQAHFFGSLGLTKADRAELILLQIERAEIPADRWKGFGHVFGYPDRAVEFFVQAGVHQAETGEFVQRDFRQYPTFSRETGGFVYAVPKLQGESEFEALLRAKVKVVLEDYRSRRDRYIGSEKPGVLELLRDWWDDGTGWCHPDHALAKLEFTEATAEQSAPPPAKQLENR